MGDADPSGVWVHLPAGHVSKRFEIHQRLRASDFLDGVDDVGFPETGLLDGHGELTGGALTVEGVITLVERLPCSRCLEPYEIDLREPVSRIYVLEQGQRQVNLAEELRDIVLLSLPMKPLCGPECRGLCIECGINLNLQKDHVHSNTDLLKTRNSKP